MICKIFNYLLLTLITLTALSLISLHYIYKPITSGTLYLKNAKGEARILREKETSIPHVFASSEEMALYSQGFLHA